MLDSLLSPNDALERENAKLKKIVAALMQRVEQDTERAGAAFAHFERAALLEDQVRQRTRDLEHALSLLNASNAELEDARRTAERAHANMAGAIEAIEEGFALFDKDDALLMYNSRFALHFPDVHTRVANGMRFADYIDLVSESRYLDREDGSSAEEWAHRRMRRHREPHVIFNVRLTFDRWVQISEHRTPDGGTAVLQTDITDTIRNERIERGKLLDDQSRLLRATLDHLSQGVCIFDSEATLVGWNTRIVTLLSLPPTLLRIGVSFEKLLEHFVGNQDNPQKRTRTLQSWASQTAPRLALRFEFMRDKNVTVDVFAREMPDRGFVISLTDVTAQRNAARALSEAKTRLEDRVRQRTLELEDALASEERANASKTRFVAAASHDLIQPLSAAKLYVASLADETDTAATTVKKALGALGSMENIIEALLDISKLDSGAACLEATKISLGKMLSGLRDEFEPMATQKGIRLRFVPTSEMVQSDPGFLRRIIQNIVGNAVRYTDAGSVLVGVRPRGKSVRIEVWDTGKGIAEEDRERIFGEFERAGTEEKSPSEGLGLGLAIVERACAQLGHPLTLDSIPGKGTRFTVSLERA